MLKRKLTALGLITYFCFLMISPMLGWHIHHACAESHHGFEEHTTASRTDHHDNDCKSETLLEHAFEQGAAMSHSQSCSFSTTHLLAPSLSVALVLPMFNSNSDTLMDEEDIGHPQHSHSTSLQRAPPSLLA